MTLAELYAAVGGVVGRATYSVDVSAWHHHHVPDHAGAVEWKIAWFPPGSVESCDSVIAATPEAALAALIAAFGPRPVPVATGPVADASDAVGNARLEAAGEP
jgi:hypothetical protein